MSLNARTISDFAMRKPEMIEGWLDRKLTRPEKNRVVGFYNFMGHEFNRCRQKKLEWDGMVFFDAHAPEIVKEACKKENLRRGLKDDL